MRRPSLHTFEARHRAALNHNWRIVPPASRRLGARASQPARIKHLRFTDFDARSRCTRVAAVWRFPTDASPTRRRKSEDYPARLALNPTYMGRPRASRGEFRRDAASGTRGGRAPGGGKSGEGTALIARNAGDAPAPLTMDLRAWRRRVGFAQSGVGAEDAPASVARQWTRRALGGAGTSTRRDARHVTTWSRTRRPTRGFIRV
ncbi:hypothetical protein B0H15DRAFT_1018255 [Mycena belliarum]|uniref:Uncharacterized protein n=1 Tax=Mycena belliarum TaxID=1033014 RepID=A0AAD6UDH6_9AGAR|nr:hypothetical protein B0H15DRAFT_1018255 [Mycena belliae]